jgi:secreted Zn-dependent insulinase-like peptidase
MQHKKLQAEIESKKIPINQKGGGRKPKLEIKEEVCLCLFYLRKMPTFEVLGLHFGISKTEAKETEAKDTFNYWLETLGNVLPASLLQHVEKHDSD